MEHEVLTFCISHKKPSIPTRFFDYEIALGKDGPESPTHISNLNDFWHKARPVSYSAAGSYVVADAIEAVNSSADIVGLISYRKIVCSKMLGRPAPAFSAIREVNSEELQVVDLKLARPINNNKFLVVAPVRFKDGLIGQYATSHLVIDFFDYLSLGHRMKILSDRDLQSITLSNDLILGGCEFGFYPRDWLLKTLDKLRRLGEEFLNLYSYRLHGYDNHQIRTLSFLSERLGSYFLLQELRSLYGSKLDPSLFGHMTVLTDKGHYSHNEADLEDRTNVG